LFDATCLEGDFLDIGSARCWIVLFLLRVLNYEKFLSEVASLKDDIGGLQIDMRLSLYEEGLSYF